MVCVVMPEEETRRCDFLVVAAALVDRRGFVRKVRVSRRSLSTKLLCTVDANL
jgi:hypothetical protein